MKILTTAPVYINKKRVSQRRFANAEGEESSFDGDAMSYADGDEQSYADATPKKKIDPAKLKAGIDTAAGVIGSIGGLVGSLKGAFGGSKGTKAPKSGNAPVMPNMTAPATAKSGLSTGAKIGIGIGAIVLLVVLAMAMKNKTAPTAVG